MKHTMRANIMKDYRELAFEIVYDQGYPAEGMLVAALKYMSNDDVRDMLAANELLPLEEEE